jgi:hypothetical protein
MWEKERPACLLSQNIKKESARAGRKISILEKNGAYVRPVRQAWIIPDAFFTPCIMPLFSSLPCQNMRKAEANVGGGMDKL